IDQFEQVLRRDANFGLTTNTWLHAGHSMRRFTAPELVIGFMLGIAVSAMTALFTALSGVTDVKKETFLGLAADGWTAVGTIALAVLTSALATTAAWQIWSIRDEAKRNRTILACDRYDTDPVLDNTLKTLARARKSGQLAADPAAYKTQIATVLNYLDAIAIGIDQDLYIESLARDHLVTIVKRTWSYILMTTWQNVPASILRTIIGFNRWPPSGTTEQARTLRAMPGPKE